MKHQRTRKRMFPLILLMGVGLALLPVHARPEEPTEYQVKAAFLYNFAKFVEWPEEAMAGGQSFVIGVMGRNPFGSDIDEAVAGKTVRDKPIVVRRFSKIEDAIGSHVLFISDSEAEDVVRIVRQLSRAPILTVSDLPRFAERGGMIQLLLEQNRVRFAINPAAIERAGLKPSSQLLKLARIVPEEGAKRKIPFDVGFSSFTPILCCKCRQFGLKMDRVVKGCSLLPVQVDTVDKW